MMEAQWIHDLVQNYRRQLDFLDFYNKLKSCFQRIGDEDEITREKIAILVRKVFEEETKDEEEPRDEDYVLGSEPVDKVWTDRLQHTYQDLVRDGDPRIIDLSLSITRKRDLLYKACLGYIPNKDQLPRCIEMAQSLALNQPPPNLPNCGLWKCLNLSPIQTGQGIVINTVIPEKSGVREYRIANAQGLLQFCNKHDVSAGEVFTSEMWCTAVTLDIDGKTCDALRFGSTCYPLPSIKRELMVAIREEILTLTNSKWDTQIDAPPIHVWMPEEGDCSKLSLRISIHFPSNVCFQSISDVSTFVKKICAILIKTKARYLVLHFIECGGVRYEKSNMDNLWYGVNGQRDVISLVDTIENVTGKESITLGVSNGSFSISRNERDGHLYVSQRDSSSVYKIHNIRTWIHQNIERRHMIECLVDCGIYHHNKSLRLPHQSKIQDGQHKRKLLPGKKQSSVLDALMHYPHTDMPNIRGGPVLMQYGQSSVPVCLTHCSLSLDKAKEVIHNKFSMTVTKVTERDGKAYLDVFREGDPAMGKGNYCVIKGDVHSNARMYFVLDNRGMLRVGCWSSNCRQKSMRNNTTIKLI